MIMRRLSHLSKQLHRTPSQDESNISDGEQSSVVPQSNKDITVQEKSSVVPQSKKVIDQAIYHVPTPDVETPTHHDQVFDPTHVSKKLLDKVNPKLCMDVFWTIFEQDIYITEFSQTMRAIYKEQLINLSGFVGVPLLLVASDRYQFGWMIRYLASYISNLVQEFYLSYLAIVSLTTPKSRDLLRYTGQPQLEKIIERSYGRFFSSSYPSISVQARLCCSNIQSECDYKLRAA